jgi:hypothetical protein
MCCCECKCQREREPDRVVSPERWAGLVKALEKAEQAGQLDALKRRFK